MTTLKKQVRFDANAKRCTCNSKPLAAPQPASLRQIAEAVYVFRTLDALTPSERHQMRDEVKRMDGEAVPTTKSDLYLAGAYLLGLSRVPQPDKRTNAEREARERMKADSSSAWRKKNK